MPRLIYFLGGLALLAAGAHVTITRTVGYGDTQSLLILALACGVALGSIGIGEALDNGRRGLGLMLIVALASGEAYGLLSTAERYITSREALQAPVHDAEARHAAALARLAKAQSPDAVAKAEAAKATVDAKVTAASIAKDCAKSCRQILEAQVASAQAVIERARSDVQREITAARAALADAPLPGSASPLAERLGWPAWVLDLIIAGLASLSCNGLAMGLLALGGHRPVVRETPALVAVEQPVGNVVALLPKPKGDVDRFLLERVKRVKVGTVSWAALYVGYRAWCLAGRKTPVDKRFRSASRQVA